MSGWRRSCARWSGAEAALVVAWSAFATGLLAAALARRSTGIGLLAAFCAWQMSGVWRAVHAASDAPDAPSRNAVGSK